MAISIDLTAGSPSSPAAPRASARRSPTAWRRPAPPSWCAGATSRRAAPHDFRACDVREPEQVDALVAGIVADHGRLDVAVNNAGGGPSAPADTASPRFTEAVIRLNLLPPINVAQAANRVMQAAGRRRLDREHHQRQRDAPVAQQRRLRRRQGRPDQPHHHAGHGVGPQGPGERLHRRPRSPPTTASSTTAARRASTAWPPPSPSAGSAPPPTSPTPCCSWPAPSQLRHRRQPRPPRRRRVARLPQRRPGLSPSGSTRTVLEAAQLRATRLGRPVTTSRPSHRRRGDANRLLVSSCATRVASGSSIDNAGLASNSIGDGAGVRLRIVNSSDVHGRHGTEPGRDEAPAGAGASCATSW